MSLAKVIFKAIDYMFACSQNPGSITRLGKKNIDVVKDIKYAESEWCSLDTYRPKNASGKLPVIFEIHGGGFVAGDKKYRRGQSMWFALNTGAFVVSVNYGLGPKVIFPETLVHLADAVNFVGDHAEEWGLDLSRFVVTGDSAGGWGAAQLCALQDSEYMQEKTGAKMRYKFSAAYYNCGIYDIQKALSQKVLFNLTGDICKDFAGIDVKDVASWKYIDVVGSSEYVTEKWPVSFVVYAEQDFFCGGQGETLVKRLNDLGVYEEHFGSTKFGDNHTFPLTWTNKTSKICNAKVADFLNRFFDGKINRADAKKSKAE